MFSDMVGDSEEDDDEDDFEDSGVVPNGECYWK